MKTIRILTLAAAASVAVGEASPSAQKPVLADVLQRGAEYVASYAKRASGAVIEEEYLLIEIGSARMSVPTRIGSHLVYINLNGKPMVLRDVFAIDTKPVREKTLRITELLTKPTMASWQRAQEFARENAHYFLAELILRLSDPTVVLQFMAAEHQEKFTYRPDGNKKMNGAAVVGIRFQEPTARGKKYFLGTPGNAAASGRFWLDPTTGAIHQTELWIEAPTETARVQVSYAFHPTLDLWLPKETTETYEMRQAAGGGSTMGASTYAARHLVEGKATYSNPQFHAIDLSRIER
jgi:hypothetical protein